VLIALVAAGGTATYFAVGTGGETIDAGPTATVTRGPMTVKLVETGEIQAEKRKIIRNELPWTAIITRLVEDGSMVEANEVIIEFDCKELTDAIKQQEIKVASARNEFTRASKNLELKREEMANKVRKAEDAVVDANDALQRYVESDRAIQLQDLETEIDQAKRNLAVARDQLELKLKVNEDPELKGLYSEKVIEAARFDVQKYEAAVDKAKAKLAMFKRFDHPKELRKLKTSLRDAELALKRAQLEARNEIAKAEADLQTKQIQKDMQEKEMAELEEHRDENLLRRADERGLVIYDTARRHWQTPVQVAAGEKINRRQQLMIVPDMTSLQVKTKVLEAVSRQVTPGLKAYIRLDAFPDRVWEGQVKKIAPQASAQHWFDPTVKVHDVVVEFDEYPGDIKPKMTGKVEIIVAQLDDALQVPVAAVYSERRKTYVWRVDDDGQAERVEVKVGRSNETQVEVLSGLAEGDEVLLVPEDGVEPGSGDANESAPAMPGGGTPA
jgi:HlyD family secretion protein